MVYRLNAHIWGRVYIGVFCCMRISFHCSGDCLWGWTPSIVQEQPHMLWPILTGWLVLIISSPSLRFMEFCEQQRRKPPPDRPCYLGKERSRRWARCQEPRCQRGCLSRSHGRARDLCCHRKWEHQQHYPSTCTVNCPKIAKHYCCEKLQRKGPGSLLRESDEYSCPALQCAEVPHPGGNEEPSRTDRADLQTGEGFKKVVWSHHLQNLYLSVLSHPLDLLPLVCRLRLGSRTEGWS